MSKGNNEKRADEKTTAMAKSTANIDDRSERARRSAIIRINHEATSSTEPMAHTGTTKHCFVEERSAPLLLLLLLLLAVAADDIYG